MTLAPAFLDALRQRVSLAQIIGQRVKLTKRGRDYVGLCCFHKEKTPSFNVVEDKGFAHCFGCGWSGDVIKFVMQTESLGFRETVVSLAREAGLELPEALTHVAAPQREAPPAPIAPPVDSNPRDLTEDEEKKMRRAERIADGAKSLPGTDAEHYLRRVRRLDFDWPATVMGHPSLEYWMPPPEGAPEDAKPISLGRFSAVVAIREDVEGNFAGVWVIWLAPGGVAKADVPIKKQGFAHGRGSAVRLGPPSKYLGIGEGLEDSGAALILSGFVMPFWAGLSTSGIRGLVLPPEVTHPIVFCNNDRWKRRTDKDGNVLPGWIRPGWDAAEAACARWREEGRHPRIELPLLADFNDVLKARIGRALEVA